MQMKRQTRKEPTSEAKTRPGRKGARQVSDGGKGRESGLVDSALALGANDHAARLAAARSEQERAEIALGLQQTYGNAYVQRLVQAKLTVSQPGDVYEQEADRVAAEVTRGAGEQAQRQESPEEEELLQAKLAADIQRQEVPEEEDLMMKVDDSGGLQVSERMETRIESARGGGEPLAGSARTEIEPRLGGDFSGVRVHTDAAADRLARDLSAEAFTTGQDVFFRSGTYQPETGPGKSLIAHELTHVVQQQAAPAVQRGTAPGIDEADLDEEAMAEVVAEMEAAGPAVAVGPAAEQAPAEAAVPAQNAAEQQIASAPTGVEPAPAVPAPSAAEQAPAEQAAAAEQAGVQSAHATEQATAQETATAEAAGVESVNAAGPAAAPEAAGIDAARIEAMRGMWDVAVVGAIRDAYNALAQARPNAGTALERLSSTAPVIDTVKDAYRDRNPSAYMTLSAFYQYLARRSGELRPHTEYEPVGLDEIREGINPDGEAMRQWLSAVSAAF